VAQQKNSLKIMKRNQHKEAAEKKESRLHMLGKLDNGMRRMSVTKLLFTFENSRETGALRDYEMV